MRLWLTIIVLCALLLLSRQRGGAPERIVSTTLCISFLVDLVHRLIIGPSQFLHFDPMLFITDLAVMLVLLQVAIRADRWWPLCATALQTIIVSIHVLKLLGLKGVAGIYWALTTIPFYLICAILLGGIMVQAKRVARFGKCRDWRSPSA